MKILVSGAGGLVGTALRGCGEQDELRPLQRKGRGNGLWWDPQTGETNAAGWKPDAFVHLAGENIAGRRWNEKLKSRIRDSRVTATQRLVDSLLKWDRPPFVFVSASAVGYYGNRGDEELTEESSPGTDFLADVCRDWEAATTRLEKSGIRVMHLRFGMILSGHGGALERMLPIFRLGLGGRLGSGRQWMSWIALDDVVRIIDWALTNPNAHGAYNAVAPNPITNAHFTKTLGAELHRPTFFPAPATALGLAFGEMADALLLSSQRALPKRLLAEGFRFEYSELEAALRHELRQ